jgi:cytoskeletal protein CcmA (bactofilin family)
LKKELGFSFDRESCRMIEPVENSQLKGTVVAEEVVVGGRLIGSIRALRVTPQSRSHVEGDLLSQSLAIEEGAYFDGKSRHSGDPLSTRYALAKDEVAKLEPASASQALSKPRAEIGEGFPAGKFFKF